MQTVYCAELDMMPELDASYASFYQSLIGVLCWVGESWHLPWMLKNHFISSYSATWRTPWASAAYLCIFEQFWVGAWPHISCWDWQSAFEWWDWTMSEFGHFNWKEVLGCLQIGYCSFDTVKGYQNHLTHSPVCTKYASRQLSLQSLACQPTQPIATATIPTAVLDPGISTNNTLYPAYARVNQHDCLNPEYPNGTIPDYQDFQIFGDIEEAAINNEGRRCQ